MDFQPSVNDDELNYQSPLNDSGNKEIHKLNEEMKMLETHLRLNGKKQINKKVVETKNLDDLNYLDKSDEKIQSRLFPHCVSYKVDNERVNELSKINEMSLDQEKQTEAVFDQLDHVHHEEENVASVPKSSSKIVIE